MIKAVLLDVGGTLLGATDLLENILACNTNVEAHDVIYDQLRNEFFRQVDDCRNGSAFKKVVEIIESAVEVVNKANDHCLRSVNAAQVYWKTFVSDSFVIHDADIALKRLKDRKIELIIASDADAELIYAQFEKHGWNEYISKYFISSDVKAYKPNDIFAAALKNAISNYGTDEVIFVGDSDVDIETGRKLGVRTALIGRKMEKQYGQDHSLTSLTELLDI